MIGYADVTMQSDWLFAPRQIYLYEINKLLQPSARPRQVLPYAVLTFTLQGAYLAAVDAEPTAEQRLASAARLQQAVAQQLNNNVIGESVTAAAAATPGFPAPGTPGLMAGIPLAQVSSPSTVMQPVSLASRTTPTTQSTPQKKIARVQPQPSSATKPAAMDKPILPAPSSSSSGARKMDPIKALSTMASQPMSSLHDQNATTVNRLSINHEDQRRSMSSIEPQPGPSRPFPHVPDGLQRSVGTQAKIGQPLKILTPRPWKGASDPPPASAGKVALPMHSGMSSGVSADESCSAASSVVAVEEMMATPTSRVPLSAASRSGRPSLR